jgi:hypothetical protein
MKLRFRLLLPLLVFALIPLQAAPLAPNPRGGVMILVYHNFGKDARWGRSFPSFDSDLERLDAAGFRPITLRQYITGDFTLPQGATPVVLTFDDGSAFQVKFTPSGELAPDCALAHWVDFAKTHPEFPPHGTFFINPGTGPFKQREFLQKKLDLLVKLGSEIGNHTYTHPYLNKIPTATIEKEIGLGQYYITQWLPGYDVVSFALPFGISPVPADAHLTVEGSWSGTVGHRAVAVKWHYPAVVLVGSGPAPSPYLAGLNGARLPRIQVFTPEFDKWMKYFELHPARRFVSDGARHAPGSQPK